MLFFKFTYLVDDRELYNSFIAKTSKSYKLIII